jgi:hypothetical protein
MGEMTVLIMAVTAMVLALLFFCLSARSRKRTGIPAGEVFYQDLVGQPFAAHDLGSLTLGISGKPDCLIRTSDGIVPVELKKSKRPPARDGVYPNHMIQNLAYCALVEEQLGGTSSLWPGHLCRSAGSTSGVHRLESPMAHEHDRGGSSGPLGKAGETESQSTLPLLWMRRP